MLNIKHKQPEVQYYTGKWIVTEGDILSYIEKTGIRYYIEFSDLGRKYILNNIINNKEKVGVYVPKELSIIYFVDISRDIILSSPLKITNLILGITSKEMILKKVNISWNQ